jgi:sporulation protein YlmC with PRC-barrel domain
VQNWSELSVERLKSYLLCKIFSCPWSVVNMAKQTKEKGVTKDRLVGMKVVDGNGNLVGTVTDIAFTIGKMGLSLSIEDKEGETKEVSWEQVQAAGDFVVLKPETGAQPSQAGPQQAAAQVCPTCKGPLTYIPQYQRWYCYKCQKYA